MFFLDNDKDESHSWPHENFHGGEELDFENLHRHYPEFEGKHHDLQTSLRLPADRETQTLTKDQIKSMSSFLSLFHENHLLSFFFNKCYY